MERPRRTGARSRPGPRARPGAPSAARTRSGSSRTGSGATVAAAPAGVARALAAAARAVRPDLEARRVMERLHTPFDAVELASDAVARGNLKVFEEIAPVFAVRLRPRRCSSRRSRPTNRAACCTRTSASACTSRPACSPRSARRSTRRTSPPRSSAMLCGTSRPRLAKVVGTCPADPAAARRALARGDHPLADGPVVPRTARCSARTCRTPAGPGQREGLRRPLRAGRRRRLRRARLVLPRRADALHRAPLPGVPRGRRPRGSAVHRRRSSPSRRA